MKKFSFKCSCGHVATVDAATREEAVAKIKAMETPEEVAKHFAEKHPGEPVMSQEQVFAGVEQGVYEDMAAPAAA